MLELGLVMGKKFQPYEMHIGVFMQLFADKDLYGFCDVSCANALLRHNGPDGVNPAYFQRVPVRLENNQLFKNELIKHREYLGKSPLPKISYCSIEVDTHYDFITVGDTGKELKIDDYKSPVKMSVEQSSIEPWSVSMTRTLNIFWVEEAQRRVRRKINNPLIWFVDKSINIDSKFKTKTYLQKQQLASTEPAHPNLLELVDCTAEYMRNLENQYDSYIRSATRHSIERKVSASSVTVFQQSVLTYHKRVQNIKYNIGESMSNRFGEYHRRKVWRGIHNKEHSSDEDSEGENDDEVNDGSREVRNANKQHVKGKYLGRLQSGIQLKLDKASVWTRQEPLQTISEESTEVDHANIKDEESTSINSYSRTISMHMMNFKQAQSNFDFAQNGRTFPAYSSFPRKKTFSFRALPPAKLNSTSTKSTLSDTILLDFSLPPPNPDTIRKSVHVDYQM
jgi:hypothetical protein